MTGKARWDCLGEGISASQVSQLEQYLIELERWNRSIRLVGPKEHEGISRQMVDALLPYVHILPQFPLLDIGSGAGLPGILLGILWPNERVVCLEPRGKRVSFLRHCVRLLGLVAVEVVQGRSDNILRTRPDLEKSMQMVTARAVADMERLLEQARPFLRSDGSALLPRGEERGPTVVEGWTLKEQIAYCGPAQVGKREVILYSMR